MGRQAKVWITENMNNSKVAQSQAYGHTFHCLKIHVQKQLIEKNFQSSAFLFVVQCMYLEIISVLLLQNVSFLVNSMIIEMFGLLLQQLSSDWHTL